MSARAWCRFVIIGTGVAGIAAAQAIRSTDDSAEIHIITEDPHGYYSRPGLAYYLTGELGEQTLYPIDRNDLKRLNLHWHTSQVNKIEPIEHRVELANRKMIPYDRLLIATGSYAAPISVPGIHSQGVFKLDNLSDAQAILKAARKARSAVVVGGGITALEIVEGLHAAGAKVHFFLRGARYWNNVLDDTESIIIEDRLKNEGVQIHYHTELSEIITQDNRVAGVKTKDGKQFRCEIFAYAVGVLPRLELAQAAGLKIDRGILTDPYMATSHPDIFAAGDVAQIFDPYSGKTVLDTLWNPARNSGHNAGLNMTGMQVPFKKYIAYNVTRLAGITTTIIGQVGKGIDPSMVGIARGDSETWRMLPDAVIAEKNFEINRLRLVVGEKNILGAIVMGDQTLSIPLQEIIAHKADITSIRDVLLRTNQLADIILSFWEQWRSQRVQ